MKKLLFVYNADSGVFNQLGDFAHKLISPSTYQCNLCRLTYGNILMKEEWKAFLNSLTFNKVFLFRKGFRIRFPDLKNIQLPAILLESEGSLRILVSAEELNKLESLSELVEFIKIKVASLSP